MAKKNSTPSTFDNMLNDIYGNEGSIQEITDIDKQDTFADVIEDNNKPVDKPTEDNTADDTNPSAKDDDSDIPQDVLDRMNNNTKEGK